MRALPIPADAPWPIAVRRGWSFDDFYFRSESDAIEYQTSAGIAALSIEPKEIWSLGRLVAAWELRVRSRTVLQS